MTQHAKVFELFLLLLLSFLWGASFTLIKLTVETVPPATITVIRVAIAAIVLLAIVHARGLGGSTGKVGWRAFAVQGALQSALPFTLVAWGERHIDSGLAGLLNATPPVFVFLLTLLSLLGTQGLARKGIGVFWGLLGVGWTVGLEGLGSNTRAFAALAVTGASVSYALAALYARRFDGIPPIVTAGRSMVMAAVMTAPIAIILDQPWTLRPDAAAIASLTVLSFVSTAFAMILFFRLLQTLGPLVTSSGSYLRAGFGVLLGVALLGEPITWTLVIGATSIVASVFLVTWR